MSTSISFPQVSKCHDTLVEQGITPELCQKVLLGRGVLADVAEAVVKGTLPKDRNTFRQLLGLVVATIYKIVVDYSQTLENMISVGGYTRIHPDATSFKVTGEGVVELEPEIVHLGYNALSEKVLAELDKRGLRPGKIEELLAFGATYPEVQLGFPIIALGSRGGVGESHVAYLSGGGSDRTIGLDLFDSKWDGLCRFLAFRKSV